MPQAQTAEDESHWDDDATAKVESTNERHNDSTMEIDSPNSNDEPNHEKGLENGYDDHQVNGDATAANHIKVENMEHDRMLDDDDDDHKVNGVDAEDNESVNEDNNSSQPIEDSKVKIHIYGNITLDRHLLPIGSISFLFSMKGFFGPKRKYICLRGTTRRNRVPSGEERRCA
jgi:hypothetical protein